MNPPTAFLRKGLWFAFAACLVLRLIYLGVFGDKLTAFNYEQTWAVPSISLLNGRGLMVHDDYMFGIGDMQTQRGTVLVQPSEFPPFPTDGAGYYHATDLPGYCWTLAGIWLVFGAKSFWPVKIIQALLGAALTFPIASIARRLFDERAGIWAAWVYALWLPSAYLTQMVSKECAEMLLIVPTTWLLLRHLMEGRWLDLAGAVVCFVLSVFMRTNLILLMGALVAIGMLKFPFHRCVVAGVASYAALALALVPWVARNKKWVGPEVGVKEGFYWALSWNLFDADPALKSKISEYEAMRRNPDGTTRKMMRVPPEIEPMMKKVFQERRGLFFRLGCKQLVLGPLRPLEWGYDFLPADARSYAAFHAATGRGRLAYLTNHPFAFGFKAGARLMELGVLFLSLAVFWVRRTEWKSCLWIAACYWVFLGTYAFVHVESRYIVPHTWPLALLAGACLAKLWEKWGLRQPSHAR